MFKSVESRIVESPRELDTVQRVSGRASSRDVRARHGTMDAVEIKNEYCG